MVHGLKVCQVTELTVCCSPRHKHTTSLLAATPSASRPCGPFFLPPFKTWTTDYQTHGRNQRLLHTTVYLLFTIGTCSPHSCQAFWRSRYRRLWRRCRHPPAYHECHPLTTRPCRDGSDLQRDKWRYESLRTDRSSSPWRTAISQLKTYLCSYLVCHVLQWSDGRKWNKMNARMF